MVDLIFDALLICNLFCIDIFDIAFSWTRVHQLVIIVMVQMQFDFDEWLIFALKKGLHEIITSLSLDRQWNVLQLLIPFLQRIDFNLPLLFINRTNAHYSDIFPIQVASVVERDLSWRLVCHFARNVEVLFFYIHIFNKRNYNENHN